MKAADYVFKQQVINTVANVIQLYWNLVYFNDNLDVKRRAVAVSQKLYDDNKKQVEVGTLAPISVVQAEAEVASDQQAVVQAAPLAAVALLGMYGATMARCLAPR